MTSKTTKPACVGQDRLRDVKAVAAGDIAEFTPLASVLQERFIAARFGLAADRARVVAALAFGEVR